MSQDPRVPSPRNRRPHTGAPRDGRRPLNPQDMRRTHAAPGSTNNNGFDRRTPGPPSARRKVRRKSPVFSVVIVCLIFAAIALAIYLVNRENPLNTPGFGDVSAAPGNRDPNADIRTTEQLLLMNDPSLPLSGKLILLDPGHGGTDSGAVYPFDQPRYYEAEWNLAIAEATRDKLEAQGAVVIMLRDDDAWVSLYHRVALAHLYAMEYAKQTGELTLSDSEVRELTGMLDDIIEINSDTVDSGGMGLMSGTGVGADLAKLFAQEILLDNVLYVSIHCNSNEMSSLHGAQVYYVTDDTVAESERRLLEEDPSYQNRADFPDREVYYGRDNDRNAVLATYIYDGILSSVPQLETNAQSTVAENFAVLREHNLTGVMVEVGFMTNADDRDVLTDDTSQEKIAEGICNGILAFYSDGN